MLSHDKTRAITSMRASSLAPSWQASAVLKKTVANAVRIGLDHPITSTASGTQHSNRRRSIWAWSQTEIHKKFFFHLASLMGHLAPTCADQFYDARKKRALVDAAESTGNRKRSP